MTTVVCPHCNGAGSVDARDLLQGPGRVQRNHPATSRQAAAVDFGSDRYRVLEALLAAGPSTARELAKFMVDNGQFITHNQVNTRFGELRPHYVDVVRDSNGVEQTRVNDSGKSGRVHCITSFGSKLTRFLQTEKWTHT